MSERKRVPRVVTYALIGWLSGFVALLVIGLSWPFIFPAIVRPEHYYGSGPNLIQILVVVLVLTTPAALIGGIIGSRVSMEGGEGGQRLIAFIFAVVFSLPFICGGLWWFTGF